MKSHDELVLGDPSSILILEMMALDLQTLWSSIPNLTFICTEDGHQNVQRHVECLASGLPVGYLTPSEDWAATVCWGNAV